MVHGSLVWLLDVEDLRAVYYWELRGVWLALNDLARKYWDDLPEHVRRAIKRTLNDVEAELSELEVDLVSILPEKSLVVRGERV
ncbi:MAG: hypothetical protein GSR81_06020 [Desulfurococcales archaeon]|nr:hypothetical protein [Desulfurococcales archaeon]